MFCSFNKPFIYRILHSNIETCLKLYHVKKKPIKGKHSLDPMLFSTS